MTQHVPVIDVGAILTNDRQALAEASAAIGRAARDIGFFSIIHHGVGLELIDAAFAQARNFFALPLSMKERLSIERSDAYRGYARLAFEQFDPSHPPDAKESFDIGVDRNQWPEDPAFRGTLETYFTALLSLAIDVHRLIAIDLQLDPDHFTRLFERPMAMLRLLRYPPHPGEFDGTLHGAAPHTDYGTITLLAQDDVGGLALRNRDGAWIEVPSIPGAFVCNIGDCLMRWSNDVYVSNLHRVVNRADRPRFSIAFFGDPSADALVRCLPSCTDASRPPKYEPITYGEYFRERVTAAFPAMTSPEGPLPGVAR